MASSSTPRARSFKATGTIAANRFVKYGAVDTSTKAPTIVQAGAGDHACGVSLGAATSGQTIEVALPGGGALLDIAGTVGSGKKLISDANGKGIYAANAGDWVGALSVDAGVTGDTIGVEVVAFETSGAES